MCEKGERLARTVGHKEDVHVAPRSLLATGEGAEEPCLHDGLGLEVVGYLLVHLGAHKRYNYDYAAKIYYFLE